MGSVGQWAWLAQAKNAEGWTAGRRSCHSRQIAPVPPRAPPPIRQSIKSKLSAILCHCAHISLHTKPLLAHRPFRPQHCVVPHRLSRTGSVHGTMQSLRTRPRTESRVYADLLMWSSAHAPATSHAPSPETKSHATPPRTPQGYQSCRCSRPSLR